MKIKNKNILVVLYGKVDAYPPTLNMINVLSNKGFNVTLLSRDNESIANLLRNNVEIIYSSPRIGIKKQMSGTVFLKTYLYFIFFVKLFFLLRLKNNNLVLAYDPIALAMTSLAKKKKHLLWYHNHDLLEINKSSSAFQKYFKQIEINAIKRIHLFTLPSIERKEYFDLSDFNGNFHLVPNYPSLSFYEPFFNSRNKQINNEFHIIFQGSIGKGHGIEEFISLLSAHKTLNGKELFLNLKGKIDFEYKNEIATLSESFGVANKIVFHGYTDYAKVPELTSMCHLGIAIFTGADSMNLTLGSASNKIYEYAATGTPVIYFGNAHFEKYLGEFNWAFPTDLSESSLLHILREVDENFSRLSSIAHEDFKKNFYFENSIDTMLDLPIFDVFHESSH